MRRGQIKIKKHSVICIDACVSILGHTHTHKHTHAYTRTSYTQTYTYTHIFPFWHTNARTHRHPHAHAHTHAHVHTFSYIHTFVYTRMQQQNFNPLTLFLSKLALQTLMIIDTRTRICIHIRIRIHKKHRTGPWCKWSLPGLDYCRGHQVRVWLQQWLCRHIYKNAQDYTHWQLGVFSKINSLKTHANMNKTHASIYV